MQVLLLKMSLEKIVCFLFKLRNTIFLSLYKYLFKRSVQFYTFEFLLIYFCLTSISSTLRIIEKKTNLVKIGFRIIGFCFL